MQLPPLEQTLLNLLKGKGIIGEEGRVIDEEVEEISEDKIEILNGKKELFKYEGSLKLLRVEKK
tara:strand:+ start:93 stop:284 length:192 start_codon:yes stop_codon:yes gene_type:complete